MSIPEEGLRKVLRTPVTPDFTISEEIMKDYATSVINRSFLEPLDDESSIFGIRGTPVTEKEGSVWDRTTLDGTFGGAIWKIILNRSEESLVSDAPLPGFDAQKHLERHHQKLWHRAASNLNDPLYKKFFEEVRTAVNPQQLDFWARKIQEQEEINEMIANDPLGYMAAVLTGAVGESVLLTLLTGGLAALPTTALAAKRIFSATRLAAMGSRPSAARGAVGVGAAGAAIGASDALLHAYTDPSMTEVDILLASLFGAGIGSGVGGYLGMRLNTVRETERLLKEAEESGALANRADLSAAAVEDGIPELTTSRVISSPFMGRWANQPWYKLGVIPRLLYHARSVRSRLASARRDAQEMGDKYPEATQGVGASLGVFFERIANQFRQNVGDIGGVARPETIEDLMELHRGMVSLAEGKITKVYEQFLKELPESTVISRARAKMGSSWHPNMSKDIDQASLLNLSDLYYQAKYFDGDEDAAKAVVDDFIKIQPNINREKAEKVLNEIGKPVEDYYKRMYGEMVKANVVPEDSWKPGYRPQHWNAEAMAADPITAKLLIAIGASKSPHDDFLRRAADLLEEERSVATPSESAIEKGVSKEPVVTEETLVTPEILEMLRSEDVTFEKIIQADPTIASIIQRMWEEKILDTMTKKLEDLAEAKDTKVSIVVGALAGVAQRDIAFALRKAERQLATLRERFETNFRGQAGMWKLGGIQKSLRLIAKKEAQIQRLRDTESLLNATIGRGVDRENMRDVLEVLTSSRRSMRQDIKKASSEQRKTLNKIQKKLEKDVSLKQIPGKVLDEIYDKLAHNTRGGVLLSLGDETTPFKKSVSPWERRVLNLEGVRHLPWARKFFHEDTLTNIHSYNRKTSPRMALLRVFTPVLLAAGQITRKQFDSAVWRKNADMVSYIKQWTDKEMTSAMEAAQGKSFAKELNSKFNVWKELRDLTLDRATGEDIFNMSERMRKTGQITGDFVVSTMLGHALLSAVPDIGTVMGAGSRINKGFFKHITKNKTWDAFVKASKNKHYANDLLFSIIDAQDMINNASIRVMVDDINDVVEQPGSWFWLRRISSNLADLTYKVNLLGPWSVIIRKAGGRAISRQMFEDLPQLAAGKLDTKMVAWYAEKGIDAKVAKEMMDMLKKHHVDMKDGLLFPDVGKWAEAGREDLVDKLSMAIRRAAGEFLVVPGLYDTPFMARTSWGQFMFQLAAFPYAVGEHWLGPALQRSILHKDPASAMGLLMIPPLAVASHALRMLVRGEDPEKVKRELQTPAFFVQAMVRSPFMVGLSSIAADAAFPQLQWVNSASGVRIVPQVSKRYFSPVSAITGPGGSLANAVSQSASAGLRGNWETSFNVIDARAPLWNSVIISALNRLVEGGQ